MHILDRYIIREFLLPFLYCLTAFVFLYITIDLFGHLDEILKYHVALQTIRDYYLSMVPTIFIQTSPIAVLLATLYILVRLNRHNEITGMKASGINLLRILKPLLCLGLLITTMAFIVNDRIVPQAFLTSQTIKQEKMRRVAKKKKDKVIKDVTLCGTKNRIYYANSYHPAQKRLFGVIVLEHDENNLLKTKIIAKSAQWTGEEWKSYEVTIYNYQKGQMVGKSLVFKEKILDLDERPADFLRSEIQPDFMSYRQLEDYIDRFKTSGYKPVKELVNLHCKISLPFINLIIILIGAPFALASKRGGAWAGIVMCIAISILIISYYGAIAVSVALGETGFLPPAVSAWLANVVFGAVGIVLIGKTPK